MPDGGLPNFAAMHHPYNAVRNGEVFTFSGTPLTIATQIATNTYSNRSTPHRAARRRHVAQGATSLACSCSALCAARPGRSALQRPCAVERDVQTSAQNPQARHASGKQSSPPGETTDQAQGTHERKASSHTMPSRLLCGATPARLLPPPPRGPRGVGAGVPLRRPPSVAAVALRGFPRSRVAPAGEQIGVGASGEPILLVKCRHKCGPASGWPQRRVPAASAPALPAGDALNTIGARPWGDRRRLMRRRRPIDTNGDRHRRNKGRHAGVCVRGQHAARRSLPAARRIRPRRPNGAWAYALRSNAGHLATRNKGRPLSGPRPPCPTRPTPRHSPASQRLGPVTRPKRTLRCQGVPWGSGTTQRARHLLK